MWVYLYIELYALLVLLRWIINTMIPYDFLIYPYDYFTIFSLSSIFISLFLIRAYLFAQLPYLAFCFWNTETLSHWISPCVVPLGRLWVQDSLGNPSSCWHRACLHFTDSLSSMCRVLAQEERLTDSVPWALLLLTSLILMCTMTLQLQYWGWQSHRVTVVLLGVEAPTALICSFGTLHEQKTTNFN